MREKRIFAERVTVLHSDEVRKKYFLVYEGEVTEVIYFDAVNNLKEVIGLAIKNEEKFCEDIEKLKENVGSNIGLLISEMRK